MDVLAGSSCVDDVGRLRKEALFETLSGILSPTDDIRAAAEERIKALEVTEEFGVHLAELIVDRNGLLPIRQLASVLLKQYITAHWTENSDKYLPPEVAPGAKTAIKQLIPQCLNESISKVRSSIAYAIAAIAAWDWPESWPELFPLLMQLLQSGETNSVHGAMRVLTEFCGDINDTQMPAVALNIFPEMYKVFMETENYGIRTRSRAVSIFSSCTAVIGYTATYNKDALSSLLYPILPQFTEALVLGLQTPDGHTSDSGLKKEVLKALCVLFRIVPNKIAAWLPQILPPVWNLLTECARVYVNTVVNHFDEPDNLVDSDGEDLGFQSLVLNVFTFVTTLLEIKRFRLTIKQGMTDLMYYIVLYMQITEDQVRDWSENPDQFVEDEDEETFSYSIRISAHDLLLELTQEFGKESSVGLCNAVTKHLQEVVQQKQIGNSNWWKIEEACMLSLGNTSFIFLTQFKKGDLVFDLNSFLQSVVLNGLNSDASPFHTGRCLWFASKYIPAMSTELIQNFLQATVGGIQQDQPISVRIIAVRAIRGFCGHLQTSNPNLIAPFLPALGESLITMITQFSASQEVLALALETLNLLIMVNKEFTASMETKISPLAIAIFLKFSSDPVITPITMDIFKTLCQNDLCVNPLQVKLLPTLISIINAPENKVAGNLQTVALDILQTLVRNSPKPLSDALVHQVFPAVVQCLRNTEDNSVLQQGGECLRSYVSCNIDAIIKWHDECGNSGLWYVVQVATQLLNPNSSEFAATFVGRLVSTLISKAGPTHLGDNMDLLLKAVLSKMQRADTLTVVQNLIMVFALLIHTQREAILEFLSGFPGPEGGSALQYVLTEWCGKQSHFFGCYVNKVSTIALCKILEHGIRTNDSRLTEIQVKGDEIFSNTRKTRSKSVQEPYQWVMVPVLVKIFKLIVNELNQIQCENLSKDESEDDDEEESWEDEEPDSQGNIENLFAPASDYPGYDADTVSDDEDDPDAIGDPIYHMDLNKYLTDFLTSFIQQPFFNVFSTHLTDCEKSILSNLPSSSMS